MLYLSDERLKIMGNYVTLVVAILTCFIGIITSIIAYSQMKMASAKVKLDLYERRFNVYVAALNYYQALYSKPIEEEKICKLEFVRVCRESKFLFNEDDGISEILDTIIKAGAQIAPYVDYIEQNGYLNPNNPYKEALYALTIFVKNLKELEEKIKPYIQFENVRGWNLF